MNWVYFSFKGAFILTGIISVLLGKYLPVKTIIPKKAKYKVVNEKKYVKACRLIFYCIGIYYILLGVLMMLIKGWFGIVGVFTPIIPALIVVVLSPNWRKYTEPLNELGNSK